MHCLALRLVAFAAAACALGGAVRAEDISAGATVDARVCDCRPKYSGQHCQDFESDSGGGVSPPGSAGGLSSSVRDARLQCASEHCGGNNGECKHVQIQNSKLTFVAAPVDASFSTLFALLSPTSPLVDALEVGSSEIARVMKNAFGILDASKPSYASLFHGYVHLPKDGNYSVGIRGKKDGARLWLTSEWSCATAMPSKRAPRIYPYVPQISARQRPLFGCGDTSRRASTASMQSFQADICGQQHAAERLVRSFRHGGRSRRYCCRRRCTPDCRHAGKQRVDVRNRQLQPLLHRQVRHARVHSCMQRKVGKMR